MDAERFTELEDLTADLVQLHLELGELVAAERVQRVRAYEDSGMESVAAADRYADGACLDLTEQIIKLKAEIKAGEVHWDFLMAMYQRGD